MVKLSEPHRPAFEQEMDRTFAALADPTRRAILSRMATAGEDGVRVTELAEPFMGTMSLPAVSKHVRVLERAGLLKQQRDGRVRRCMLDAEPLRQAAEWVAFYKQFWSDRLDALADYLESKPSK
ncbi:MAG: metalloregulator ArsR/SmtB family transcription factor [Planctomycetota bacterium]